MILLPDYHGYTMADDYASFSQILVWYRMFCENECGAGRNDYINGFAKLKDAYKGIFQYIDNGPSIPIHRIIAPYFQNIESLLNFDEFGSHEISRIASLLYNFELIENNGPNSFRALCLEYRIEEDCKVTYPKRLFNAVYPLLKAEKHDASIVESFKYLDSILQSIVGVSSHEQYGENLINMVFAPNAGKLQVDTHSNEQQGLRNFFSGANAIFRNPSAHRSQFDGSDAPYWRQGEDFSMTVVAIIGLMVRITVNVFQQNHDKLASEILTRIATKNNWSAEIDRGYGFWRCSPIPDSSYRGWSKYRMRVKINYDEGGIWFDVSTHESVSFLDAKALANYLEQHTGYTARLIS